MDQINKTFKTLKKKYDAGQNPLDEIGVLAQQCINRLCNNTRELDYKSLGQKHYYVLADQELSRPFRKDLFIMNAEDFRLKWQQLLAARGDCKFNLSDTDINKVVYTAVMSFAMCFDIWKNKSRKTPGTFFEVVLGSLIAFILPQGFTRTKFIPLIQAEVADIDGSSEAAQVGIGDDAEAVEDSGNVSTDIVFKINDAKSLVIPAKTTTRERVVQPFAHQRILDSFFGEGVYVSLLCCVSETQRDDDDVKVNDICVPNTIKLFQKHLAKMGGIFYLDPPARYLTLNGENGLKVGTIGALLCSDLNEIIELHGA